MIIVKVRSLSLFLLAVLLASLPLVVFADKITITGMINGLDCAVHGDVCPIDRLDPHIAIESDFVLQRPDGEYYLLTNLPRDVKVRYVLEVVQVTGDLIEKYNSIRVDEFRVKHDEDFRTVWSPELQARTWEDITQPGATRH